MAINTATIEEEKNLVGSWSNENFTEKEKNELLTSPTQLLIVEYNFGKYKCFFLNEIGERMGKVKYYPNISFPKKLEAKEHRKGIKVYWEKLNESEPIKKKK